MHVFAFCYINLSNFMTTSILKKHLMIFLQKNEIDLEALMLMSEQDYADIGLPKVILTEFALL